MLIRIIKARTLTPKQHKNYGVSFFSGGGGGWNTINKFNGRVDEFEQIEMEENENAV